MESDSESNSITDSKSDSGWKLDSATDSIVLMIEGGVRVGTVVGLGHSMESESASDAESHLVSDSETDSGLDTQCTIRFNTLRLLH